MDETTRHFDHAKVQMAEKELAAFVSAVSELFGSTEAQQSAEDWIEIVTLMSCQTRGASPDWRQVTITAAGWQVVSILGPWVRCRTRNCPAISSEIHFLSVG